MKKKSMQFHFMLEMHLTIDLFTISATFHSSTGGLSRPESWIKELCWKSFKRKICKEKGFSNYVEIEKMFIWISDHDKV